MLISCGFVDRALVYDPDREQQTRRHNTNAALLLFRKALQGKLVVRDQKIHLRESEERYARLAEKFPRGALLILDRDLRITFALGRGLEESGSLPELLVGKLLKQIAPPEVVALAEPHLRAAFEGQPATYQVPYADGNADFVAVTPLLDPNGLINEILVVSQDISQPTRGSEALTGLLAREQTLRNEAEILRDANIALTQNLSLTTVLETLLDYLGRLVPYDSANVMLLDGDSKFNVSALRRYESFQDVETTQAIAFDADANLLLRRICTTRQSVLVADTNAEPDWQWARGAEHVRNWLGIPLIAHGKVIGLYSVDKTEPRFFTAEHARLAETLASRAATAIQNAQLFQQSQRYVGELVERISERKRAEAALRESEERYRELFDNSRDAIYVHDLDGTYRSVNRAAEKLLGYTRDEIIGKTFADFVAREHIRFVRETLCRKLAEKGETTYEVDVITKEGSRVPVEVSSRSIYENGAVAGVQGTARDITDRKRAREALQMFSRRLIEAQEAERQRIARELHDQIGQVLTGVKINLQIVQRLCSAPEASTYIKDNINVIDEALQQVRDLSVDLRPPQLDDLGLVTALRWYVHRQSRRTGVRADFLTELDHNQRFSRDLETACFRITQEALTNVIRHAHAKRISVQLRRDRRNLFLVVKDDGVGFNVEALRQRAPLTATLGLLGMQERAHSVGGTIEIDSGSSKGTEIRSRFPIKIRT